VAQSRSDTKRGRGGERMGRQRCGGLSHAFPSLDRHPPHEFGPPRGKKEKRREGRGGEGCRRFVVRSDPVWIARTSSTMLWSGCGMGRSGYRKEKRKKGKKGYRRSARWSANAVGSIELQTSCSQEVSTRRKKKEGKGRKGERITLAWSELKCGSISAD